MIVGVADIVVRLEKASAFDRRIACRWSLSPSKMLYTGYAPTPARLDAKGIWCRLFTSRARDITISFWRRRTSPLPLGGWITLAIVPPYDLPGAMSGVVESAPREREMHLETGGGRSGPSACQDRIYV